MGCSTYAHIWILLYSTLDDSRKKLLRQNKLCFEFNHQLSQSFEALDTKVKNSVKDQWMRNTDDVLYCCRKI